MPRRNPPDLHDIAATLLQNLIAPDRTPDDPVVPGEAHAVRWDIAVKRVKDKYHTTRPTAEQWIKNTLALPDSELAGLLVEFGDTERMATTHEQPEVRRDDMGWPAEIRAAVRFDSIGRLLDLNTARLPHPQVAWIVRSATLPTIRATIERQLQDRNHQQALRQAEKDAEFVALHGDDLATITRLVDGIRDPFTDESNPAKIITTSVATGTGSTRLAEVCGTNGRLTIELWGHQITAFADRIRALQNPDDAEPNRTAT